MGPKHYSYMDSNGQKQVMNLGQSSKSLRHREYQYIISVLQEQGIGLNSFLPAMLFFSTYGHLNERRGIGYGCT